jgi:calcium/calmodulin-dependent 3',5'-cyclic nucleotide phosphodiesterase
VIRRLCDEDDELSVVEPDVVPSEVRDWLALTFTRSMSNIKRRGEDKPKFKSVAHAIRAGIILDITIFKGQVVLPVFGFV